jgi:hypothetical protein
VELSSVAGEALGLPQQSLQWILRVIFYKISQNTQQLVPCVPVISIRVTWLFEPRYPSFFDSSRRSPVHDRDEPGHELKPSHSTDAFLMARPMKKVHFQGPIMGRHARLPFLRPVWEQRLHSPIPPTGLGTCGTSELDSKTEPAEPVWKAEHNKLLFLLAIFSGYTIGRA